MAVPPYRKVNCIKIRGGVGKFFRKKEDDEKLIYKGGTSPRNFIEFNTAIINSICDKQMTVE